MLKQFSLFYALFQGVELQIFFYVLKGTFKWRAKFNIEWEKRILTVLFFAIFAIALDILCGVVPIVWRFYDRITRD